MAWKTLDDMDLKGKRVLTRVDINVPMDGPVITDATRIEKIVPTVKTILAAGGLPILLAHFGRPKGKAVPEMSLARLIPTLHSSLQTTVGFAEDCIQELEDGIPQLLLLAVTPPQHFTSLPCFLPHDCNSCTHAAYPFK